MRVQLKRVKGWRLPPNTVVVTRSGAWGNPFIPIDPKNEQHVRNCVAMFHRHAIWMPCEHLRTGYGETWTIHRKFIGICNDLGQPMNPWDVVHRYFQNMRSRWSILAGKNLACYCPLDAPCHADVIWELANKTHPKEAAK